MFTAQLYGKTISGKTMTEIKRKASRIANGYWNMVDRIRKVDFGKLENIIFKGV